MGAFALIASLVLETILPIPDRPQHADSPPSGWCGETAIQEALLYFGVWSSQRRIHAAGKSKHPDLYSDDIPKALDGLGVRYEKWGGQKTTYLAWVEAAIDAGEPVLAGVKILPSDHPTWGLDHFVLAVGHGPKGLLVNTTWNQRVWASDKSTKGISFAKAFYALRLHGEAGAPRLEVVGETGGKVKLRARCVSGAHLERRAQPKVPLPARTDSLIQGELTFEVPVEESAYFRCVP